MEARVQRVKHDHAYKAKAKAMTKDVQKKIQLSSSKTFPRTGLIVNNFFSCAIIENPHCIYPCISIKCSHMK